MSLSKNEIKFLKSLQQKKYRDSEGLFVVEGVKLADEIFLSDTELHSVYHTADYIPQIPAHIPQTEIGPAELERISGLKSPNKVLVVAHMKQDAQLDLTEENLILMLDDVKDPGNLGTIIRTADWFGVNQIVCSPESVDMYNPKVVQASMGAVFRMNVVYSDLLKSIHDLKGQGYSAFGADMNGNNAFESNLPEKTVLVMGSESHGLSDEIKSEVEAITIPKFGESESLNVAMASGILMSLYVNN